jgi:toxin ParE1/3/4
MEQRWSSAAESELAGAAEFYEGRAKGLGVEFLDEAQQLAALLAEFPNLGVSVSDARREVLLNRFPYRLVYDLDDAGVRIIAVAHQKQRPGYWQWRVEEDRMRYAA